jgi:uncharacterized membrane protein YbhN (UPF0104 family)
VYYVGRDVTRQWTEFRSQPLDADVRWSSLALSGAVVLATYAMLVQTWRILLASTGATLPFSRAARIWTISNLWRYVPGKVWQIGAMSAMAQRERVSAISAAGTAILSTILNIATGLALVLLLGWRWLDDWNAAGHPLALGLLALAALGLVALPFVLPRLGALAARLAGRDVKLEAPPPGAIAMAAIGNLLSWILYGVAFLWLVQGLLGSASGATWQYVAVFTASYVVGYLFILLPGGIGPREAVMIGLLTSLGLATEKQAVLVAVGSRLWLTFLELVPGLLFLAYDRLRPRPPLTPSSDVPPRTH